MPRKHTNNSFDVVLHQTAPTVYRIGPYQTLNSKLLVGCRICGHNWTVVPKNITVGGTGCPSCNHDSKRTDFSQITALLAAREIQVLERPINNNTPIRLRCLRDSTHSIWSTSVSALLHQLHRCPTCAGNKQYTHEEIQSKFEDIGTGLKLVEVYRGMNNKITVSCSAGHEWLVTPANIIHGGSHECPICHPYKHGIGFGKRTLVDNIVFRSKFEAECYTALKSSGIVFETQRKYGFKRYTCDFYIPSSAHWIEVSSFRNQRYLERIKAKRTFVTEALCQQFSFVSSLDEMHSLLELEHG